MTPNSPGPVMVDGRKSQRAKSVADLAAEVAALTGAELPEVMRDDAPVLAAPPVSEDAVYYVGLIGGKDVGKTSLVNAIAGVTVAKPTGHGEGTRTAIAYCHADVADEVRRDLAELGAKLEVVPHEAKHLRRQVLLDLPDIDSKYADHIQLTRRMLRYMLYPIWVQSIEKYADQRPRELLKQVADGNDPQNFLFVLSKIDQLVDREGDDAARELADDFADRLQRALDLPLPPEVLAVSSTRPDKYDLERLREKLGVERTVEQVTADRGKAVKRRSLTVAKWVEQQDLAGREEAAKRLLDEAAEMLAERVVSPILDTALPRLSDDAGHRMALAEPAAQARCRSWPIVGWIDLALAPIVSLVRRNLSPATTEAAALEAHLNDAGESTSKNIRGVFAQLHAAYPPVAEAYADRHLWETPDAEAAAGSLRRRLDGALRVQRQQVAEKLKPSGWAAPIRWLLTVGVVIWFVLVQPLLVIFLPERDWSWMELVQEAVALLSAQSLLASLGIVVAYLVFLWAAIRIKAYRRVAAWRKKLARADADDAEASPAAQTLLWLEDLLAPLQRRHDQLADLQRQAQALRQAA